MCQRILQRFIHPVADGLLLYLPADGVEQGSGAEDQQDQGCYERAVLQGVKNSKKCSGFRTLEGSEPKRQNRGCLIYFHCFTMCFFVMTWLFHSFGFRTLKGSEP